MDKLVIGGRGVYRTQLHVHGTASHSGGNKPSPNAIDKAAHLIRELGAAELSDGTSEDFPLPGKVTVTAIEGGQGYSVTPDLCTLNIDIRTTPRTSGSMLLPARGSEQVLIENGTKLCRYDSPLLRKIG